MTQDWSTWLDRLEASTDAQRAALAQGRHDLAQGRHDSVGASPARPDLGPLPATLEERARDLLRANEALVAELAVACAAHVRQLRLLSTLQPAALGASFLDTRT